VGKRRVVELDGWKGTELWVVLKTMLDMQCVLQAMGSHCEFSIAQQSNQRGHHQSPGRIHELASKEMGNVGT
jgi:hypothetical protein